MVSCLRYNRAGNHMGAQMNEAVGLMVSELTSALQRAKRHLVVSQLLISGALFLALKFIH